MRLLAAGERIDDLVGRDRDAIEIVPAERIGDRAQERGCTGAHHGLANAFRAERALRIRHVDGVGGTSR